MLKDLYKFRKKGYWLAVVVRRQKIKVVAVSKNPGQALQEARQQGFNNASLMMSASRYAAWTS